MTQEELRLIQSGGANLEYCGNIYECIGEQQPLGFIYQSLNDDSSITKRDDELLQDETAAPQPLTDAQYLEKVHQLDAENRAKLEECDCAIVLFQLKPDLPERRNISFLGYESACKELSKERGEDSRPEQDMYWAAYVLPMTDETMRTVAKSGGASDFYKSLANFTYQYFNHPEMRPSVFDGYFGHSASPSDVIVVKEQDTMTAMYIDNIGFRLMEDFMEKKPEAKAKDNGKEME